MHKYFTSYGTIAYVHTQLQGSVEGNIRLPDKLVVSVPYSNGPRITGHLAYYSDDIQLVVLSNNGLILTIKILD